MSRYLIVARGALSAPRSGRQPEGRIIAAESRVDAWEAFEAEPGELRRGHLMARVDEDGDPQTAFLSPIEEWRP